MARPRGQPYRILLPLANPRTARDLVRIGAGVGHGRRTEITALGIVEVPEGVSLSDTPSGTSTMPRAVISVRRPCPTPAPIRTRSRAVRGLASGRRMR